MTVHKAQGLTIEQALLLGTDALYRELGYVGMSRGRQANQLYVVETREPGELHTRRLESLDLTVPLSRRREQRLALDQYCRHDPELADLYQQRDTLRAQLRRAPSDPDREVNALTSQLDQQRQQRAAVADALATIEAGRRAWRKEHPDRAMLTARETQIDAAIDDLSVQLRRAHIDLPQRQAEYQQHENDYRRLGDLDGAIDNRLNTLADAHELAPPGYLADSLGAVPKQARGRDAWRDAAKRVEAHRAKHHIDDPTDLLGRRPPDPAVRVMWDITRRDVDDATRRLEHARAREQGREPPDLGRGWSR